MAGASHLSHIFLPFSRVAWPLGPTLCGFLLLYAVYLPSTLRAAPKSPTLDQCNLWFVSIGVAVFLTTIGGLILMHAFEDGLRWWRSVRGVSNVEWLLYLLLVAGYTYAVRKLFSKRITRVLRRVSQEYPFPEFATGAVVAVLLLLAYVGGRFDGYMDAMMGECAMR